MPAAAETNRGRRTVKATAMVVTKYMEFTIYHWILITAFVGVVVREFGRKRKARFQKDARIPFEGGKG